MGWYCSNVTVGLDLTSVCYDIRGDGIKTIDEGCDDGNLDPGDGCDFDGTDLFVDTPFYTCSETMELFSICIA